MHNYIDINFCKYSVDYKVVKVSQGLYTRHLHAYFEKWVSREPEHKLICIHEVGTCRHLRSQVDIAK